MVDTPMDEIDPDDALMVACRQGDVNAFEQILVKYHKIIVNFLYKFVNNPEEAEELAQDVFLRLYRARASYEPRKCFSAWLYRIAANVGIKRARKRAYSPDGHRATHQDSADCELNYLEDRAPDAENRMVGQETGRIIRHALRSMPQKEKVALILLRYQHLSYQEIGEVMNCTEAAVKTHIHRGKLRLREALLPYLQKGLI